jgi:hypothetical protein
MLTETLRVNLLRKRKKILTDREELLVGAIDPDIKLKIEK